jgi:hypothetical protein
MFLRMMKGRLYCITGFRDSHGQVQHITRRALRSDLEDVAQIKAAREKRKKLGTEFRKSADEVERLRQAAWDAMVTELGRRGLHYGRGELRKRRKVFKTKTPRS